MRVWDVIYRIEFQGIEAETEEEANKIAESMDMNQADDGEIIETRLVEDFQDEEEFQ